ncbi:hypothetical protein PQQ32_08170 [Brachyspira hyodysenteriae]|uniref:hypothetical protein n=1 Tax=Brachyspira hyodysenteriae TaxID=159 RepID=UPI0022CD7C65|nr:hypothetical protein [Brachyspira hyodysenteriae]MCZ9892359.1 hypothetical protein [Brachyspira hyodysenteriae]MCZ9989906.1 hypothetical protein [Brachyspira hyodysenteriae]MDA0039557.1 hypothetical protein [Brachyspira hyodysenteriae]MDA0041236.1 hypothetical protein [Brachyspira hyodysenteriae]MDA0041604.1 hypothetical protein [Brachyspira hyodysenteriae]
MPKESITELSKKETSLIEKYIKLKNDEKKNKEDIEDLKDDLYKILKKHEGKIVHNGYNISMHESITYQYSEAIVNIETEIKVLKQREETLQIASISKITEYAKVYKLKDKNESKNE